MGMLKRYGSGTGAQTTIDMIAACMRHIVGSDPSRIISLEGLMVHDSPAGGGTVERVSLQSVFFDEDKCPCGDFIARSHDGEGLILGRKLDHLAEEELKRVLAYLENFPVLESVDREVRRDFSPPVISALARTIGRYRSTFRHA